MRRTKSIPPILTIVVAICLLMMGTLRAGNEGHPAISAAAAETLSGDVLLVNAEYPLAEDYEPTELVNLYAQTRHFRLAKSDIMLERVAFDAANRMFAQAEQDGVNGFIVTSGYRTWDEQSELYDDGANANAAAPGTSEHQTGLAFDVTARRDSGGFEDTDQFAWLIENCWDFGFILRYPEYREEMTGFSYEPWHYRYVGKDIARMIRDNGWTLEEYCEVN